MVLLNGCRLTKNRRVQLVSLQRVPTQTPTPRHCMRNDYTSAPKISDGQQIPNPRLLQRTVVEKTLPLPQQPQTMTNIVQEDTFTILN